MTIFKFMKRKEKHTMKDRRRCIKVTKEHTEFFKVDIELKILGSGCMKCNQLEKNVIAALQELGRKASIEHVKEFDEIAKYGVITTPALVMNEQVVSIGKVLKPSDVMTIIKEALSE